MSTEEQAFLQAIIAAPDDDTPRLVYCDWLDERGDPRGEFIRVQCYLAAHPGSCHCYSHGGILTEDAELGPLCEFCRCRRREQELLAHHALDWLANVDGLAAHYNTGTAEYGWLVKHAGEGARRIAAEFHRGFVHAVTCTLADWRGDECSECRGTTIVMLPSPDDDDDLAYNCPACHGTGRVNARGPQLVACTPLERVTLSDFIPFQLSPSSGWVFHYTDENGDRPPPELRDVIHQAYPTEVAALDALSAACLAWARQPALLQSPV